MTVSPWIAIKEKANKEGLQIIGVDEAGRGPLFGPVVAGAVLWSSDLTLDELACSKTLSQKKRAALLPEIQSLATAWATAEASVVEIDTLNILRASLLAMERAVDKVFNQANLDPASAIVLVDGNKLPDWGYQSMAIVKGDKWVPAISAASILAKEARDAWCLEQAEIFPGYGLAQHMGYPTAAHLEAIERLGCTELHRKSFGPVKRRMARPSQVTLFD